MSKAEPISNRPTVSAKTPSPSMPASTSRLMSADFIPQPGTDFVSTPTIQDLTDRALAYLQIGYSIHLSGPAGTGKTTLAMHIAAQLGRPCTLLHGDDEMRGSDLVGKDSGYRRQSVRDNYVSSILKTEETVSLMWNSNRLTIACEQGHTLIYDEFTRSPAAANNTLLSVLEEGILNIPSSGQEKGYIKVHPNFRAIFTSNPEEYAGVHKSQDALLDRMITLEVDHHDRATEIAIVQAKSKRTSDEAAVIIDIIRGLRSKLGSASGPTIRAGLAIAHIVDYRQCQVSAQDPVFCTTCQDLLYYNASRQSTQRVSRQDITDLVQKYAKSPATALASVSTKQTKKANHVEDDLSQLTSIHESMNELQQVVTNSADRSAISSEQSAAPFASRQKEVITPNVMESLLDRAKIDDQIKEFAPGRSSIARALPKPPSFDSSLNSLASS